MCECREVQIVGLTLEYTEKFNLGYVKVKDLGFLSLHIRQEVGMIQSRREATTWKKRLIIEEIGDDIAANNKILIDLVFTSRPFAQGRLPELLNEVSTPLNASVAPFTF